MASWMARCVGKRQKRVFWGCRLNMSIWCFCPLLPYFQLFYLCSTCRWPILEPFKKVDIMMTTIYHLGNWRQWLLGTIEGPTGNTIYLDLPIQWRLMKVNYSFTYSYHDLFVAQWSLTPLYISTSGTICSKNAHPISWICWVHEAYKAYIPSRLPNWWISTYGLYPHYILIVGLRKRGFLI